MIKVVNSLKVVFITLIFFLIFDLTLGKYIYKKYVRVQLQDINLNFSETDEVFDHKFPKNFDAVGGWGNLRYQLCTDSNGFKTSCLSKNKNKKIFDIAFIGDSFTEGQGYEYEKTFVGIIDNKLKNKKVANLAMSSYSPAIYYTKINYLISKGYKFKEIIVFIDLSDLADDILCYELNEKKVERKNSFKTCFNNFNLKQNNILKFIKRNLNFTYILLKTIDDNTLKKIDTGENFNVWNHSRAEWTYNYNKKIYNNLDLDEAISVSTNHMIKLYNLLKKNSIDLSVAVYPWPGTLKNDNVENLQVKVWRDFCMKKCKKFYNFMPFFFTELDKYNFDNIYSNYFIENDVHYNFNGNKFIADNFLNQYLN